MTSSARSTHGPPGRHFHRTRDVAWFGLSTVGLLSGVLLFAFGAGDAARVAWALTTVLGVAPAAWWVIDAARRGRVGVDLIALVALIGTLWVREYLAGALVTVMLASGRTLEARANARARRELHSLLARAPKTAHRYEDGGLASPSIEDVRPGDLLMVQSGEVVPVDGTVERETATIDEAALTGEPLPVEHGVGDTVRSGAVNAGGPFDLRATTSAAESTYAGIVRLVSQAEASNAPFVRLADQYAGRFLLVTFALAGVAWAVSGDVVRAVAVLVVATPCPLILAAPVAIVSGLSLAASRGVIVKSGAALERLARGRDPAHGQDGHDHRRSTDRGRRGRGRRAALRRGVAARRLARPGVAARARGGGRPSRAQSLARAQPADRGRRSSRLRSPGRRRRQECRRRESQLDGAPGRPLGALDPPTR